MAKSVSKREDREYILDFKIGQTFNNYTILSKNNGKAGGNAIPIGSGGSGIVYLTEQTFIEDIKVKRAIKFFVYRDDIAKKIQEEWEETPSIISSKNFHDEIINICSFNHENIIKIIDGGITKRNEFEIPFIVTDFVDGHNLENLITSPDLFDVYFEKPDDIIDLFGQICKGYIYLSNNNFYHCDIAPKNIFIKGKKGSFQIIIGDLGVGKTIRNARRTSKINVIGTKKYMPHEALNLLYKPVSVEKFLELQPKWDHFSLKQTFLELADSFEKKNKINSAWFKSLKRIIERPFTDFHEVADNIERQKPLHRQFHGVPELSEADSTNSGSKQLQPIKPVWITSRIRQIIRHPLFWRLKKVPQILSGNTFSPGTNYSRYEHSLGTYENMRQVLITLLRKEEFMGIFTKSKIELALISSLLSSISKFPFSFVIHEIRLTTSKKFYPNISQTILVNSILDYQVKAKGITESLWDIIEREFGAQISRETLVNLITNNDSPSWGIEENVISFLLNSSIDVRVLDFLQRDSYHLGISTSANFDFDNLIENLTIFEKKNPNDFSIVLNSKGVVPAEQLLTLRYWLYKRIYWNSPNRAYFAVLKYVLMKLYHELGNEFELEFAERIIFGDPIHLFYFIDKLTSRHEYLAPINDLLRTIYSEKHRTFKEIFVLNQSESEYLKLNIDWDSYSKNDFADIEKKREGLEEEIRKIIPLDKDKINILIDVPSDDNKKLGGDIEVLKHNGNLIELNKFSGIVKGISESFNDNLKFLRIYVHPDCDLTSITLQQKETISTIIKNYLKSTSSSR